MIRVYDQSNPSCPGPTPDQYEAACDRIDAWRRAAPGRFVSTTSRTGQVRMRAIDGREIAARAFGINLYRCTVQLAEGLPLPAPARVPVEPAQPAGQGREPSGVHDTVRPRRGAP